jgi:hypothetical protein
MKTKKITAADRKEMLKKIGELDQKGKDQALADLILFAQRAIPILDELTRDSSLTSKEKKEIEDSIKVGPQWLNFTRTIRRKK